MFESLFVIATCPEPAEAIPGGIFLLTIPATPAFDKATAGRRRLLQDFQSLWAGLYFYRRPGAAYSAFVVQDLVIF